MEEGVSNESKENASPQVRDPGRWWCYGLNTSPPSNSSVEMPWEDIQEVGPRRGSRVVRVEPS